MHSTYKSSALRELRDQQVRFAPREKKIEQAGRAELLIGELNPEETYTYEYVSSRITNYRPTEHAGERLSGSEASHDLRLFVEDVSDAADVSIDEAGEEVLTIEEVAEKFNVSTKTIARWRHQGLVSRRFVDGGRKRVGFLSSSVERFVDNNSDRIERGTKFSQMTDEERQMIVDRARRFASQGASQAEVVRRLSRKTGRSAEAIRYTLRRFDETHPHAAIFPNRWGPMDDQVKQEILQRFSQGETVDSLAENYGRTRTSIYRVVGEMRAKRILALPLDYIDSEEFEAAFDNSKFEAEVLGPMPEAIPFRKVSRPSDLPAYLSALYEIPLLSQEQEMHLFRKMNYLKWKATKLREQLDPSRPRSRLMDRIESCYEDAVDAKNELVRANLRLVVSIAKRHVSASVNFFELVSDGNISLMRAVEKFDYSRGNKFSTYATWAITKNYARSIPTELRHQDRFRASGTDMLYDTPMETREDRLDTEQGQIAMQRRVNKLLGCLDSREQQVIISRFGLGQGRSPQTLRQVGAEMGVTKERIRQLEARALGKLRRVAGEEFVGFFE